MFSGQEHLEDLCDVVARARGRGKDGLLYKRILKTFKLEGDFIALELSRDSETDGWWVTASIEETAERGAGYGAEYFEKYIDALKCFSGISEKYGLEDPMGTDYGSD